MFLIMFCQNRAALKESFVFFIRFVDAMQAFVYAWPTDDLRLLW